MRSNPFTDNAPLSEVELERRRREQLAEEQARREQVEPERALQHPYRRDERRATTPAREE